MSKQKTSYKDSVASPSYLNLLADTEVGAGKLRI